MLSKEIRRQFLHYFASQGHTIVPSSPVVPRDDPTLLFANAGMNQFKDVFLGKSKRDYVRASTVQKCIRSSDFDNVGHTSRHCTFFEMLGNFSFGDYFKKEAMGFAWDVATHVFGFDPKRIWVSVYKDDDEAFALWEKYLPAERIVRFGEKENFWAMGDTGPCGPCSELLYDRGPTFGPAKTPYDDPSGERFLEFWNLVFMQFSRDSSGELTPLPKRSIDTGSGLERVASLRLGVDNVFLTDILRSLIASVERISGIPYDEKNPALAPAFHVIADHIRTLSFAIADGAQPSNTDRGYVLRKVLRRAVRYGRMLGLQRPFLANVLPSLIDAMGEDFPELNTARARIAETLTLEEEAFFRTLQRGGNILGQIIERSSTSQKIAGEDAFKLKDTYGFPIEEILIIAKDSGIGIDLPAFEKLEEEAREKSRKARKVEAQQFDQNFFSDFTRTHKPCIFEGYQHTNSEAILIGLVVQGRFVDELREGEAGMLLLDRTPFYAEMGGQVGDTGTIVHGDALFTVEDCIAPYPGVVAHLGRLSKGVLHKGNRVRASVNEKRRLSIQNHHTATHLLHFALQNILGPHVRQAGSLVDADRLRFDFHHHKAVTSEELRAVERFVNAEIRSDRPVDIYELSYQEAQKRTDIQQLFGEQYGEKVRVVDIGTCKELCGGTHTMRTGNIGLFKVVKEGSVAAGIRRIEALTGLQAELHVEHEEDLLQQLSTSLKTSPISLVEKTDQLLNENRQLAKDLQILRKAQLSDIATALVREKKQINGIPFLSAAIDISQEDFVSFADDLMRRLSSGVIALGASFGETCQILVKVSPDFVQRGIHAQRLIKEAAPLIGGGGGGRDAQAQAGGKNPSGLRAALEKIEQLLS